MALNMKKHNLRTYVVCAGVAYGYGDKALYKILRQTFTNELGFVIRLYARPIITERALIASHAFMSRTFVRALKN